LNEEMKIYYYTFKPEEPITPRKLSYEYTWLSNIDIVNVMRQYEEIFPNFRFFGPLPTDFQEIMHIMVADVCKQKNTIANLYRKGIRRIGLIINLDKHGEPGSHWVAIFIDLTDKINKETDQHTIEYFDSVGNNPNKYIKDYITHVCKRVNENTNIKYPTEVKNKIKKLVNVIPHQKQNTECGVYSMFYIVSRLYGKTFDDICGKNVKPIRDEEIHKFRKLFFRPTRYTNYS